MQHLHSLQDAQVKSAWLTIGVFDGVHLAHQKIIRDLAAAAHAQSSPAVVLSFSPHPAEILRGPLSSFYLSDPAEKVEQLAGLGVDVFITHPFTREVANTSARDFVAQLKKHLGLAQLWVGHDFALGHNREGNVPLLQSLGRELGFEVHLIEVVKLDGEIISSSRIRALLAEGKVEQAARLLGRPYALSGEIVGGAKRGRVMGIPTANIAVPETRAVPGLGIYVTWATLGSRRWGSVTSIGVRPTFEAGATKPVVETHLLDYGGGEIYGETLRLDFIARLRPEQRFSGVEELVAQIHRDIEAGRLVLAERAEGWWNERLP
ncbi:MAG: bifunctional riboflavin kinase/FAD synthetase [Anaerolineales bacterium]